jgi:hypothetical protein
MTRATLLGFRGVLGLVVGASLVGATTLTPGIARADGEVSATGKGIAGGALLGAEAIVTIEAVAGVKAPWAYAVGAIVGAGGGGVAGHFAEQSSNPHVPLYLLAGGVALVIPALVVSLNATAYKPPADYQEDKAPTGTEPAADVPQPPAAAPTAPAATAPTTVPPPAAPQSSLRYKFQTPRAEIAPPATSYSMVQLSDSSVRMGVPGVEVRPVFSAAEVRQYGMAQKEEVRIPLFSAVF